MCSLVRGSPAPLIHLDKPRINTNRSKKSEIHKQPFVAVDDDFVAFPADGRSDVGRVRGRDFCRREE
jgi:hypothetical protein